jgi:GTP-binding protein HflX
LIEVWNKIDRLDADGRVRLQNLAERQPADHRPVLVSALSGEGVDRLNAAIEARLAARRVVLDLALDPADGAGVSWLHRHTEVMDKAMAPEGHLVMKVRVDPAKAEVVRAKFK